MNLLVARAQGKRAAQHKEYYSCHILHNFSILFVVLRHPSICGVIPEISVTLVPVTLA